MNKMITSVNRNGDITISINGKHIKDFGAHHFGITMDTVNGIPLNDAHNNAIFIVADKVSDNGTTHGLILYTLQKQSADKAIVHYILSKHTTC